MRDPKETGQKQRPIQDIWAITEGKKKRGEGLVLNILGKAMKQLGLPARKQPKGARQ